MSTSISYNRNGTVTLTKPGGSITVQRGQENSTALTFFADVIFPTPETVELAQLRIAIIRAGAAAQLNTHVLSLSAENRVKLEQVKEIRRDSQVYNRLCTALGLNETQRDNLFRVAGNIDLSE